MYGPVPDAADVVPVGIDDVQVIPLPRDDPAYGVQDFNLLSESNGKAQGPLNLDPTASRFNPDRVTKISL